MNVDLVEKNSGLVVAQFISHAENYDLAVNGTIYTVDTWNKDSTPDEKSFFAEVNVKWDGCSHFWLYGEDYTKERNEVDGYYHVCGIVSYIQHALFMLFAYEVMMLKVGDRVFETERKRYEELGGNLLAGYKLVVTEE